MGDGANGLEGAMDERERVIAVARGQRMLLRAVGASMLAMVVFGWSVAASMDWVTFFAIPAALGSVALVEVVNISLQVKARIHWVFVAASVLLLVVVAMLGLMVGDIAMAAVFGLLFMLFDCASVSGRVTKRLARAGVRVGFLGVRKEEMQRLRSGVCFFCGYDMAGLPTSVCPECGEESRIGAG